MHKEELLGPRIFLLHNFLTPAQCQAFIDRSEVAGYQEAPITTGAGPLLRKDIRDNERLMVDDPALAAAWWESAREYLPQRYVNWEATGFNERFRYYRYDVGQRFAKHYDGAFRRDNGEQSQYTFMAYLNDDFEGGSTNFFLGDDTIRVQPGTGTALVFVHKILHEGAPVLSGRKYVLRTDLMYRRSEETGVA
jgi:predicted 2-oxoglutarate/Fe(II)-dependent dioxygenase YbiX